MWDDDDLHSSPNIIRVVNINQEVNETKRPSLTINIMRSFYTSLT